MDLEDLKIAYQEKRRLYGEKAYLYVSVIFEELKDRYEREYMSSTRAQRKVEAGGTPESGQSWRAFKGKNFEKLVLYILESEIQSLGLECIPGTKLENRKLSRELSTIRRNLVVHYGSYDILPDVDLVIYEPNTLKVMGVISCKITLRERIAQTAYWKLKLAADPVTEQVKVYFVTPDEDEDLVHKADPSSDSRGFKNRILVEHELDGTYVLADVEESDKVKSFDKFVLDLRILLRRRR